MACTYTCKVYILLILSCVCLFFLGCDSLVSDSLCTIDNLGFVHNNNNNIL